jgi:ArsR family transcriptional regulator, arsenate/arsenite/antimonite-responsive transcriptional repressor
VCGVKTCRMNIHLWVYACAVLLRVPTIAALKHPSQKVSKSAATLIHIYECFCDETRLRIVNLLTQGPLCVCHLQELLDSTQVRISEHLGYLKAKGVLNAERRQNWMIYSLPTHPSAELEANLKCLQDCIQTRPVFQRDLRRLKAMQPEVGWLARGKMTKSE